MTRLSWQSPRAIFILLAVMISGFAADVATKSWAFRNVAGQPVVLEPEQLINNSHFMPIPFHEGVVAIPGRVLNFRLVLNDGVIFGLGSQQRGVWIVFTFGALALAMWIFSHTTARNTMVHFAIGLVLGGGFGNLYDRIFVGRVRDFMHLFPDRHLPFGWSWPGGTSELFPWIFNTGDILLLTGMALLMIYYWKQPTTETATSSNDQPDLK